MGSAADSAADPTERVGFDSRALWRIRSVDFLQLKVFELGSSTTLMKPMFDRLFAKSEVASSAQKRRVIATDFSEEMMIERPDSHPKEESRNSKTPPSFDPADVGFWVGS